MVRPSLAVCFCPSLRRSDLAACRGDARPPRAPGGQQRKDGHLSRGAANCRAANCPLAWNSAPGEPDPSAISSTARNGCCWTKSRSAVRILEIRMPGYLRSVLIADAAGDELQGEIILVKPAQGSACAAAWDLGETIASSPNAGGRSRRCVGPLGGEFIDDDGESESAVGEFSPSGDMVSGTFLTPTGDHRFLAGQVQGDELYLSTFDGAHVFLYKAKIAADGSLAGTCGRARLSREMDRQARRCRRCRMPTDSRQ